MRKADGETMYSSRLRDPQKTGTGKEGVYYRYGKSHLVEKEQRRRDSA